MPKSKGPEKDNTERYLITYADLMNLLLILFIILYSMSKTDVAKATAVAESIRKGFNAQASSSQQSPSSSATTSTAVNQGNVSSTETDYSQFYDQLMALIKKAGMQNQVDVQADQSSVVITLKDTALYAPGVAAMNTQATNLMSSIGTLLTKVNFALILVEGYTDSDPIHTSRVEDNLDLSTQRANNVNRLLVSRGVDKKKVYSLGHGENDNIAPNDTKAHKAMNRRVVITIYKTTNSLTPDQIIAAKDLLKVYSTPSNKSPASSAASGTTSSASK